MHISLFMSGLSGGGAQRRLLNLARGFVERDHQVDILVGNDDGPFRSEVPAAARLVCLGSRWTQWPLLRHRRGLWVPALMPALAHFLAGERPEAVLATSTPANLTALGARAMAGTATPVVISVNVHLSGSTVGARRSYGAIVRRLVASAYPHADAIVAISPDIAADLAATAGVARNRIAVIGNPVDREGIERAAAAPVEHPWLQPGQPPVVLAVGKLKKQKDFPTLIRAFARVLHQRPARLIVLGEGEERARLQAMVTRMGLSDVVSMPGFVTNPYCWMARASVFVLSSAWEGLSNALLEALACGCPAVSTDCPSGPRNVLANGTFGPLVPVGDDTAMAEAILSLLAEPPAAERLRDRVRAFALDRSTERYLEVLEAASTRCRTAKAIRVAPGPELLEP